MWIKSCITFLLLLASIGQAQVISGYGVKFGMVSSKQIFERGRSRILTLDSYLDRDLNPRLGPQIGLFAQFLNARHLNLQSEVSYLQKGAEEEFYPTRVGPDGTYITDEPFTVETFQFDYIAFSVLAQPKVSIGQIEPYILVGSSLNILTANREWVLRDADSLTPYSKRNSKFLYLSDKGLRPQTDNSKFHFSARHFSVWYFCRGNIQKTEK